MRKRTYHVTREMKGLLGPRGTREKVQRIMYKRGVNIGECIISSLGLKLLPVFGLALGILVLLLVGRSRLFRLFPGPGLERDYLSLPRRGGTLGVLKRGGLL